MPGKAQIIETVVIDGEIALLHHKSLHVFLADEPSPIKAQHRAIEDVPANHDTKRYVRSVRKASPVSVQATGDEPADGAMNEG